MLTSMSNLFLKLVERGQGAEVIKLMKNVYRRWPSVLINFTSCAAALISSRTGD